MVDRGFNEVDVRMMFENAIECIRDNVKGRWLVKTRHKQKNWAIIVEPDVEEEVIVVITAFPVYGEIK